MKTTLYRRATVWVKREIDYETAAELYGKGVNMDDAIEHYLSKIEPESEHSLKLAWSISDMEPGNFEDEAAERFSDNRMTASEKAEKLWREFERVPINPQTEKLERDWNTLEYGTFEKGLHREDIWHWFEETFGVSVAARFEEGHF